MKLYLLSQNVNQGYDTFDSTVVCAKSEEEARFIHPMKSFDSKYRWDGADQSYGAWANAEDVQVEYLGTAKKGMKRGVICASFNAG